MNNQIIMSDSISEEHPDELDPSLDDIITTTFQFIFKTYLFGGTEQSSSSYTNKNGTVYDGFIPIITSLSGDFWYPIPKAVNDYDAYIDNVDKMPEPIKFRDELVWKINETVDT